jgi:hypothetical protein
MPEERKKVVKKIPDFDVLSEEPDKCATILKEKLMSEGIKHVKVINHDSIGEIIPEHIEIRIDTETIAYIYKPIACHSYNKITIDNREINIATIDTILTFYLSFLYINNKIYNKNRLLCMVNYLFDVEQENRLAQKGLLKRFSIDCYGKQLTLDDLRSEKAEKYKELANDQNSKEYEMWFLKYSPRGKDNRIIKKGIIKKKKPKTKKQISVLEKYLRSQNRKTHKKH